MHRSSPSRATILLPAARLSVFTAAEARGAGWSPDALERATSSGRLVRLRRGVYTPAGLDPDVHPADRARRDRARQAIAVGLTTRGATVSALAAATVEGWPVWAPREQACVTVCGSTNTSLSGVHLHRGGIRAAAWRDDAGYRITRATRTVVDVAREHGTEAGLVVADAAVASRATTAERLQDEVDRLIGRRGVAAARPLPALVDGRSESVLESRSRWRFVVHDIPPPTPQMWIYDLAGHFLGRTDFYWVDGVVGEVDGAGKLEDPEARRDILTRQLRLGRAGLRIVRWGARDLVPFDPTAAWLREELAAAAGDRRPRRWFASPVRLGAGTAA